MSAGPPSSDDARKKLPSSTTSAISTVRDAAGQRLARQDAQIEAMSDKTQTLKNELMGAREQAPVDALTKLHNRGAFDEHVARRLQHGGARTRSPGSASIGFMSAGSLSARHSWRMHDHLGG